MQMYFIAIVLPQYLNEKVLDHKNMMLESFDCKVGLKSPSHITIIPPFWLEEKLEEQLADELNQFSGSIKPFMLKTNNFSAFKPRTIFIALEENQYLNDVKSKADKLFGNRDLFKIKTDNRPFHPHITIATRDLYKKSFREAWPLFEKKEFREEWMTSGISLLRH